MRIFVEEKLKRDLTFVHLAIIMGIQTNQLPPIEFIEREVDKLVEMGSYQRT